MIKLFDPKHFRAHLGKVRPTAGIALFKQLLVLDRTWQTSQCGENHSQDTVSSAGSTNSFILIMQFQFSIPHKLIAATRGPGDNKTSAPRGPVLKQNRTSISVEEAYHSHLFCFMFYYYPNFRATFHVKPFLYFPTQEDVSAQLQVHMAKVGQLCLTLSSFYYQKPIIEKEHPPTLF